MDKNIRIAKELLKIAKGLVADTQTIGKFRIEGKVNTFVNNKLCSIFTYSPLYGSTLGRIQIKMPENITANTSKKEFLNNYLNQNKGSIEQELLKDFITYWDKDYFQLSGFKEDFFKHPINITSMEVVEQSESPMFYVNVKFTREYGSETEIGDIKLIPEADTEAAINSMFANADNIVLDDDVNEGLEDKTY